MTSWNTSQRPYSKNCPGTPYPLIRLWLYGAPGWNLERGPFFNREKNKWTNYSICIIETKKAWAEKRNRQLIWTSRYERNSLISILFISCWRLETISINFHKTPVECFEYAVATLHDHPGITTTLTRSPLC